MKAVLDELAALGAQPLETLTPEQARTQPSPADAVRSLLAKQGMSTEPEAVGSVQDSTFPGPAGELPIRIYKPAQGPADGSALPVNAQEEHVNAKVVRVAPSPARRRPRRSPRGFGSSTR